MPNIKETFYTFSSGKKQYLLCSLIGMNFTRTSGELHKSNNYTCRQEAQYRHGFTAKETASG